MGYSSEKEATSMFDSLKNSASAERFTNWMRGSKDAFLWCIVYAAAGFIAGFFFKHYSRYLIVALLFIGVLFGLHHMGIVSIAVNQDKLNSFFGLQSGTGHDQVIMMFFEWIKANVLIAIAFLIGFLLGIRVG